MPAQKRRTPPMAKKIAKKAPKKKPAKKKTSYS
jgi:hypothetical protein